MNKQYKGGAIRSGSLPRYRDVGFSFINRVATAFKIGTKYEVEKGLPPWQKNWKLGDIEFALDCLDHAEAHVFKYRENVLAQLNGQEIPFPEEDHLANAGANLVMLDHFEANGYWNAPQKDVVEEPEPQQEPNTVPQSKIYEITNAGTRILKSLGLGCLIMVVGLANCSW